VNLEENVTGELIWDRGNEERKEGSVTCLARKSVKPIEVKQEEQNTYASKMEFEV
jgi:hypothetical protein